MFGYFIVLTIVKAETRSTYFPLRLVYAIPEQLQYVKPGDFCVLPVRQAKGLKKFVGVFWQFCEKPSFSCSYLEEIIPFTRPIPASIFSLLAWVGKYYLYPFDKLVPLLAPGAIWRVEKHTAYKKLLDKKTKDMDNVADMHACKDIVLNAEQQHAYAGIIDTQQGVSLLHGVTGSGKTEVYIKLAMHVIAQKRKVLILVPEIALTPQMSKRFQNFFGTRLAVLHSSISKQEYLFSWHRVQNSQVDVVLGVRTSIFVPVENIGLIIVDEEHDQSYKAQDFPIYHARDVAVVRAKLENALCVLGSATPSIESIYNVQQNKYHYFQLTNKFYGNNVSSAIIDFKQHLLGHTLGKQKLVLRASQMEFPEQSISPEICELLRNNKKNSEQSMLIINRRGYFNYAACRECGNALSCPNCAVTTTLHAKGKQEICHYCNYNAPVRTQCPLCHSGYLMYKGVGTQNIVEQLQTLLPELNIDRLDRDVLTSNTRVSEIIEKFSSGATDCLVGTQMLAKGHDFPKVTLVVVLHVEDSLFIPDFRAAERTFQLLSQAMGRAGRGSKPGVVVLQSLVVGHPVIKLALQNAVPEFCKRELSIRNIGFHPPYSRQILLELRHKNKEKVMLQAQQLKNSLIAAWQNANISVHEVRLAGPHFATIERLQDTYRVQICISAVRSLHPERLIDAQIIHTTKNLRIDVDPVAFL